MDSLPIQAYDVAMLVVLALTTLFGLWKGAAWQLASLASLIVSAIVALRFSGPLAPYLSDEEWAPFAAMLILYLVTSLAIWIAFRFVAKAIDRLKLQEFDHQIGAMFGIAKGVLLCLVITFFAVTLSEQTRQAVARTWSGRAASYLIKQGTPLIPEEARAKLQTYLEEFDRKLNEPPAPEAAPPSPVRPLEAPAKPSTGPADARPNGLRDIVPGRDRRAETPNRSRIGDRAFPVEISLPGRT